MARSKYPVIALVSHQEVRKYFLMCLSVQRGLNSLVLPGLSHLKKFLSKRYQNNKRMSKIILRQITVIQMKGVLRSSFCQSLGVAFVPLPNEFILFCSTQVPKSYAPIPWPGLISIHHSSSNIDLNASEK